MSSILATSFFFLTQNASDAVNGRWIQPTKDTWKYLENGKTQYGWKKVDKYWYFLDKQTGVMKKGWRLINDYWYYLDPKNGDMKTGWKLIDNYWYYLDPKNGDMKTKWKFINNKWYYLDPKNGDMKTKWKFINNKWYYLDPKNGDMKTGWLVYNNEKYYLHPVNGDMFLGDFSLKNEKFTTNKNGVVSKLVYVNKIDNSNSTSSTVTPKPVPNPTVKTPVVKTPVVKKPVVKTPVVKKPVIKTPVVKTPVVKVPEAPVVKKDDVRVDSKTEREVLKYKTVSKHSSGQSRIKQRGTDGYIERTYKITYKNGVQVSKELSNTKTVNPQDEIIQHYVKVRDAKYETREVDDKSRPIHEGKSIPRWFVSWGPEGKERTVEYYYDEGKAFNRYDQIVAEGKYFVNWGDAENEFDPNGGRVIGYEKKTEKVKVQDEVWLWE
ncbi:MULTISPECIES: G5 domain-containing protein [Helcococcus]|uniref:G5 domain-containing protein n=1 Tax=Helcococcus TaxID=31983 RepID=UPI0038BAC0C2